MTSLACFRTCSTGFDCGVVGSGEAFRGLFLPRIFLILLTISLSEVVVVGFFGAENVGFFYSMDAVSDRVATFERAVSSTVVGTS